MTDERGAESFAREQVRILLDPSAHSPAVLYNGEWSTWSDLAGCASAIESRLDELGVRHRAPVALVVRNRPSGVAALLGLLATGRVPLLVSPIQPATAIARAIEALAPGVVIVDETDFSEELRSAVERIGAGCLSLGGEVAVVVEPTAEFPSDRLAADDAALIVPTSGTTGEPKPIPIRWSQLPFAAGTGFRGAPPADRPPVIHALSMATITGVMGVLRAVASGRPLAMLERVEVGEWAALVHRFQLRRAGLPPAAMRTMLDVGVPKVHLSSLEAWITGSAPLDPALQKEFETFFEVPVLVAYGATEFGGAVASWTLDLHQEWAEEKLGSVGRAVPGVELLVVDEESGVALSPDEVGVLSVRMPRSGGDGGWMRTNDRVRIDEDGFLFIVGRADDVIVRGGFKVSLGEIESMFRDHPAVRDVAAVGLAESRLGQVPGAAVVLHDASEVTSDELRAWAREHTAPYKVPTVIQVLPSLPMSASHKVDRAELRALLGGIDGPSDSGNVGADEAL